MGKSIIIPEGCEFTLHNIPFGIITTQENHSPRCAIAVGDFALDLILYAKNGHLQSLIVDRAILWEQIMAQKCLNEFAALPAGLRKQVRCKIIKDISEASIAENCFVSLADVTMHLPFQICGFSDFYCSLEHCINCSPMSAGMIPKNWFYAPSVYNSRVSSIVPSSTNIRIPKGIYFKPGTEQEAVYGPYQQLDFELEMGYFVSKPVPFGETLSIDNVRESIFGFVLLNDWSSRDLQLFEMKPLGPFHGKGFGTTISTWVVTMDALEEFQCRPKTVQDPIPFDHLRWRWQDDGTFDIKLKVTLIRQQRQYILATSNLRYLYWTPYQQLVHHASAMCGLQTGDLMGTGTISGDGVDDKGNKTELGCLYEATQSGSVAVVLADGNELIYLNDGDEIVFGAWCGTEAGEVKIGFGDCRGKIIAA